jgi:hypothetical protein
MDDRELRTFLTLYGVFSRFMEKDAEQFFLRRELNPELVCSTLAAARDNLR